MPAKKANSQTKDVLAYGLSPPTAAQNAIAENNKQTSPLVRLPTEIKCKIMEELLGNRRLGFGFIPDPISSYPIDPKLLIPKGWAPYCEEARQQWDLIAADPSILGEGKKTVAVRGHLSCIAADESPQDRPERDQDDPEETLQDYMTWLQAQQEEVGRPQEELDGGLEEPEMEPEMEDDDENSAGGTGSAASDENNFPLYALRVCRGLYEIGVQVLYQTNTFSFSNPEAWRRWPKVLQGWQAEAVRKMSFVVWVQERDTREVDAKNRWTLDDGSQLNTFKLGDKSGAVLKKFVGLRKLDLCLLMQPFKDRERGMDGTEVVRAGMREVMEGLKGLAMWKAVEEAETKMKGLSVEVHIWRPDYFPNREMGEMAEGLLIAFRQAEEARKKKAKEDRARNLKRKREIGDVGGKGDEEVEG